MRHLCIVVTMKTPDEPRDGRVDHLLGAALVLLNADASASMAEIAAAAGVGRATLHRHFATRDDLIREIGVRGIGRWETSLRDSGAEDLADTGDAAVQRSALRDLVTRYTQDAEDFGFVLTNPEIQQHPDLRDRCLAMIEIEIRIFAAAQRAGVLRDDVPAEWIGHVLFGLLRSGIDARHYENVAPRAIPGLVLSTFFAAVGR